MALTVLVLMMRLFVLMQMLTIRMLYAGSEDDDGGFECDGDADDDDDGCSNDGAVYGDVDDSMRCTQGDMNGHGTMLGGVYGESRGVPMREMENTYVRIYRGEERASNRDTPVNTPRTHRWTNKPSHRGKRN